MHSWNGYVIMYAGWPIIWTSKMQYLIELVTTEADYIALYTALREVIWIFNLLEELKGNGFNAHINTPKVTCHIFKDKKIWIEIALSGVFILNPGYDTARRYRGSATMRSIFQWPVARAQRIYKIHMQVFIRYQSASNYFKARQEIMVRLLCRHILGWIMTTLVMKKSVTNAFVKQICHNVRWLTDHMD